MKRRLVAALACRNQGSRLYGKPLQNIDIKNQVSILQHIINWIYTIPEIDEIVLGISEGIENSIFINVAEKNKIKYIIGSENDVLQRLVQCGKKGNATDIFRVTTESPFTYYNVIPNAWENHIRGDYSITTLDNVPDGSGFEIIQLNALMESHEKGEPRHRSELCTLYMRENKERFKFNYVAVETEMKRPDIRFTVDYPEDLVICRTVYENFRHLAPKIPVKEAIAFIDSRQDLKALVAPYVTEGIKTMYL